MYLIELYHDHYGHKSRERGITGYIVTDASDPDLVAYDELDRVFGHFEEAAEEAKASREEGEPEATASKLKGSESASAYLMLRAAELGLAYREAGPHAEVAGDYKSCVLWNRGDISDPVDLYYGATLYHWGTPREIDPEDADVLVRLDLAADLRESPSDRL